MDYGETAQLARHDSWATFLRDRPEGRLVLFTTRGATALTSFRFEADDILLFGRESSGVPDEVHAVADARVVIPIRPEARSLNLVASVAIAISEALRQTDGFPVSPVVLPRP